MKRIASAVFALLVSMPALADTDKTTRSLAATCAACHGTNGKSVGGTAVLAGMDKALFVSKMKGFKSGQIKASVMHQHAKGYTDEEIDSMGAYFAAQSRE